MSEREPRDFQESGGAAGAGDCGSCDCRSGGEPGRRPGGGSEGEGAGLRPLARKRTPTSVEQAKRASRGLRGTVAETLSGGSVQFGETDAQLIKFHGLYQQEDRDLRDARKAIGSSERSRSFMVRVKVPGGMLTAEQYLAMDALAEEVVRGRSLRLTTRQNFQLHGVLMGDLKTAIRRVNECLLSTLSGCGDVERNIVAPPAPLATPEHRALRALALELSRALTPATNAYHEIWLDAELVDTSKQRDELYGDAYLPRKLKTGLALPDDDAVEVLDQDCALIGVVGNGRLVRLNVALGGGAGLTHRKADSYARLASKLGSVDAKNAVETVRIVASIFRDFGDRTDRKHARLKHVVEELGIDAVREEFRRRAGFALQPWVEIPALRRSLWLGRHEQGDGRVFVGIAIASGRIADTSTLRLKTALAEAVRAVRPGVVLTPQQNILFTDMTTGDADRLEAVLAAFGVATGAAASQVRQRAMACPALPTCGLALAEAERIADGITGELERELERVGRAATPFDLRITGCANGCVRTYNADLGLVGRKPGHYDLYVGGDGEHLAEIYAEAVPLADVVATVRPLLEDWATRSGAQESLAAYYRRRFGRGGRGDLLSGAKDDPGWQRVAAVVGPGRRAVGDR